MRVPVFSSLEAAKVYLSQGLVPIPLRPASKVPAISDWTHFDLAEQDVEKVFGDAEINVGLLTGAPSSGLVDIDLDVSEARLLAPDFLPETGWIHGRESAAASHYMFRAPSISTRRFVDPVSGAVVVEQRADGCQSMAPPSRHPCGEMVVQEADGIPSLISPQRLEDCVRRLAAGALLALHYPQQGSRHNATNALTGMLIRGGWTEEDVLHFITSVARAASDEEWQARARNVATTAKRIVEDSPSTGAPTLAGLMPPEVVRTVGLWLGFEWNPIQAEGGASQPVAGQQPNRTLQFISLGDLLDEPEEETPWLVEGRLPAGGLSAIVAKPKVGKSTLARALALAVSRGEPWLGWETSPGPVFYLAFEEKRSEVRRHFKTMGATGEEPLQLIIGPCPVNAVAHLESAAERERPALIIVDTLQALVRVKDLNDYAVVSRALEPLVRIARHAGAHVLFVHHSRKGRTRQDGDSILGSTAIMGAVDTSIELRRTKSCRSLWTTQRYGEDQEEVVFELDPETRIPSLGGPREAFEEGRLEDAILSALRDAHGPLTEEEIDHRVSGRTGRKRAALRRLVGRKAVVRTGKGVRGARFRHSFLEAGTSNSGILVSRSLVPLRRGEQETSNSGLDSPTLVPRSPVPEGPPTGDGGAEEAEPAPAKEGRQNGRKGPHGADGSDSDT